MAKSEDSELSDFLNDNSDSLSSNDSTNVSDNLSMEKLIDNIKEKKYDHIIFMVGAGISTSAGIPDFRSEDGLFSQLEKYGLSYPEAVFDISYFRNNPEPFFDLAKKLLPGSYKPTPCHYFMKLIEDKKLMLRTYTQNIDSLERVAGISDERLVEAHGSFHTGHCINEECGRSYTFEWMKSIIADPNRKDNVLYCESCGSYVKPDIIFYGENLPHRFNYLFPIDFKNCDLLIIMGTSLTVSPFAGLINLVRKDVPRLFINRTGPHFILSKRDFFINSNTDPACLNLAEKFGWREDLEKLINGDNEQSKQ